MAMIASEQKQTGDESGKEYDIINKWDCAEQRKVTAEAQWKEMEKTHERNSEKGEMRCEETRCNAMERKKKSTLAVPIK